jgi:hypothetical protein
MPANLWQDLFDDTTSSYRDAWGGRLVPPPSAQALNGYERRTGFKLPRSYRQFVRLFGPCRMGYADVACPGYPAYGVEVDLDLMNEHYRSLYGKVREESYRGLDHGDFARFRRLVIFGNFDSDWWGWDPLEPTDPGAHEYAVWKAARLRERREADTFRGFVEAQLRQDWEDKIRYYKTDDAEIIRERANFDPPIRPVAWKRVRRRRSSE